MEQILLEAVTRPMEGRQVIKHGFTEGKSCLMKLVTFCDGETKSVDQGQHMDVICKAFDTVAHNILLAKLEKYGFDR